MGGLVRLVLVVHVSGRASGHSAGDCVMVCVMTGNTAHEGAAQAAFGGYRIGRDEGARQRNEKSKS